MIAPHALKITNTVVFDLNLFKLYKIKSKNDFSTKLVEFYQEEVSSASEVETKERKKVKRTVTFNLADTPKDDSIKVVANDNDNDDDQKGERTSSHHQNIVKKEKIEIQVGRVRQSY